MDFGRKAKDGERLLGPGKTWRGLVGGVLGGLMVGGLQLAVAGGVDNPALFPTFEPSGGKVGAASLLVIFTLALGALIGDATKSFVKRRLKLARGAKLPLADQYDFVLGAWVLTALLFRPWFQANFTLAAIVVIAVLTFFMHRAVSVLGHRMGLKAEPW